MQPLEEFFKRIFAFLDQLRAAKYSIGADDYLRLEKIFIKLASAGELPENIYDYEHIIAPIVCTSADEQFDFKDRFIEWCSKNFSEEDLKLVEPKRQPNLPSSKKRLFQLAALRKLMIIFMVLTCVSGIAYLFYTGGLDFNASVDARTNNEVPNQPNQSPASSQWQYVPVIFAVAAIAATLALLMWRIRQRRIYMKRFETERQFSLTSFFVEGLAGNLFEQSAVSRISREMRRHIPIENALYLNVDSTIDRTVNHHGFFTPVYDSIMERPEYLVLIDKHSERDHQVHYAESLINKLVANDVNVTKYYFNKDPRSSYQADGRHHAVTLEQLNIIHPNHRIIIFSQGQSFVDLVTETVKPWVSKFERWENMCMVTVNAPENWGVVERILTESGIMLIPENEQGFLSLTDTRKFASMFEPDADQVMPTDIFANASIDWVSGRKPLQEDVDLLFSDLQFYLGYEGIKWLSACAVYPEVNLQLTIYLGHQLRGRRSEPLYDHALLMKLIKLPWFRRGYMPDWLRSYLLDRLNQKNQQEIRLIIQKLIATVAESHVSQFELTYAVHNTDLIYLAIEALKAIRKKKENSVVSEEIFLSFIDDRLSIEIIGRKVKDWFFKGKWWKLIVMFAENSMKSIGQFFRSTFGKITWRTSWLMVPHYTVMIMVFSISDSDEFFIMANVVIPAAVIIVSLQRFKREEKQIRYWKAVRLGALTCLVGASVFIILSIAVYVLAGYFTWLSTVESSINYVFGYSGNYWGALIFTAGVAVYGLLISMSVACFVATPRLLINKETKTNRLFWHLATVSGMSAGFLVMLVLAFGDLAYINSWWVEVGNICVPGLAITSACVYFKRKKGSINEVIALCLGFVITAIAMAFAFAFISLVIWGLLQLGFDITTADYRLKRLWWFIPLVGPLVPAVILPFIKDSDDNDVALSTLLLRRFTRTMTPERRARLLDLSLRSIPIIAALIGALQIDDALSVPFPLSHYIILLVVLPFGNIFLQYKYIGDEHVPVWMGIDPKPLENGVSSIYAMVMGLLVSIYVIYGGGSADLLYRSFYLDVEWLNSRSPSRFVLFIITLAWYSALLWSVNRLVTRNIAKQLFPLRSEAEEKLHKDFFSEFIEITARANVTIGGIILAFCSMLTLVIGVAKNVSEFNLFSFVLSSMATSFVAIDHLGRRETRLSSRTFIIQSTAASIIASAAILTSLEYLLSKPGDKMFGVPDLSGKLLTWLGGHGLEGHLNLIIAFYSIAGFYVALLMANFGSGRVMESNFRSRRDNRMT